MNPSPLSNDSLPDVSGGTHGYIADYLSQLRSLLSAIDPDRVAQVVERLYTCWQQDRRLVFCGNGGSGSTSTHMVCDFQKNLFLDGGKPFEVVSLTDSPALLLAWSNDTDFTQAFAGQARTWLRREDVLIALSGSGNSANVLEAVAVARAAGATTIGLCGYGGGRLAAAVDLALVVDRNNMQLVEDVHSVLCHILFSALRDRVRGVLAP